MLLKNSKFSDDITFNFSKYSWSEYPLTADKFMNWISSLPESERVVNMFMNYEVLGAMQPAATGILDFFKALPQFAKEKQINFMTPSEVIDNEKSVGIFSVTNPI